MKNLLMILFVALIPCLTLAQDQTLFSGEIESGGYGGPLIKVGQINGGTGIFLGGQGGWIVNHRFVLGGKGYGLVNAVEIEGLQNIRLDFGCGGVLLEYVIASNKPVHFSIESMIGGGRVRYDVNDHKKDHDDIDFSYDSFFMIEPGVNLMLNLSTNLRLGTGVTYRYIRGVDYETLTDSDLSGVSIQLLLKFGKF